MVSTDETGSHHDRLIESQPDSVSYEELRTEMALPNSTFDLAINALDPTTVYGGAQQSGGLGGMGNTEEAWCSQKIIKNFPVS